jgi:hypothetical protein
MAEPRETGKEVNGASHPGGVRGKRSALERLNIVSNIVVALMAVFATVISLSALHMQSQDQAIAARGRAAAAFKAQRSFADRIVPLWTASSNGLSVYFHIQTTTHYRLKFGLPTCLVTTSLHLTRHMALPLLSQGMYIHWRERLALRPTFLLARYPVPK